MPMTAPAMPAPTWGSRAEHEELADALVPGERRAGPDHNGDPDSGRVLGAFQAVGVTLGGGPPQQPEPGEDHRASGDVGQVMDSVTKQADGAG